MEKRKKRKLIIQAVLIGGYIETACYLLAGAYQAGDGLTEYYESLCAILRHPFGWYFNRYSFPVMIAGAFLTALILLYEASKPDIMPGKEYGTSHFTEAEKITKKFRKKNDKSSVRIYSEHLFIGTDSKFTGINNNALIIGGSGTQKSWAIVQPNLWNEQGSFVITDPKGELLARNGNRLIQNGYVVRVLNLVNMQASDHYNPFVYIRESADIPRLINSLIANTESKESKKHDGQDFWIKAEKMFLQALFYYVWMEEPTVRQNMVSVMELINKADYVGDEASELDSIMEALAIKKGEDHLAVRNYKDCLSGAGDTIRSIFVSVKARMAPFTEPAVANLFRQDDFDIGSLGAGVDMDGKTKTAVFCVIPDYDKTYNFIIGMFYTQVCKELYTLADQVYHGRLPVPVSLWFDEFANVPLPNDFDLWIATMRSRDISCIVILQNLAQIKALFKDSWENTPGNCDVLVYLGGNDRSTHEFVSKWLGTATIYKRSSSTSYGVHGSTSTTFDPIQRELMKPDEVSMLASDKCIIKVRGQYPVLDTKYKVFETKEYAQLQQMGVYTHIPQPAPEKVFRVLTKQELADFEEESKKYPDRIRISTLTLDELMEAAVLAGEEHAPLGTIPKVKHEKKREPVHREQYSGKTLTEIMIKNTLSDTDMSFVENAIKLRLTEEQIIGLLNTDPEARQPMIQIFVGLNTLNREAPETY